jgi:hypothetical protein
MLVIGWVDSGKSRDHAGIKNIYRIFYCYEKEVV